MWRRKPRRPFSFQSEKTLYQTFIRENVPEKTIAVALILPDLTRSVAEEHLSELEKLIETAGGSVVDRVFAKRPRPDPATYVGSGKAEQLKSLAANAGAKLIVFDVRLSNTATHASQDAVNDGQVLVLANMDACQRAVLEA